MTDEIKGKQNQDILWTSQKIIIIIFLYIYTKEKKNKIKIKQKKRSFPKDATDESPTIVDDTMYYTRKVVFINFLNLFVRKWIHSAAISLILSHFCAFIYYTSRRLTMVFWKSLKANFLFIHFIIFLVSVSNAAVPSHNVCWRNWLKTTEIYALWENCFSSVRHTRIDW